MVTLPTALSILVDFTPSSETDASKFSTDAVTGFSWIPNEFLATPITLFSVVISVLLNPLFEKAFLFTTKGLVELGASTTLDA